jgi:hypothetical protein
MTPTALRLLTPCLFALLLSACDAETGQTTNPAYYAASSEARALSPAVQAQTQKSALTPEELAVDPEPAIPSDPRAEQSEIEKPDSLAAESDPVGQVTGAVVELEWDALIPEDWQPDKIMAQYNVDELEDDDPRAQELMEKLNALWKEAPVVQDLDGKRVKLPGFVVPLDMDGQQTGEFLLVPYYGACIHVPPPPANQTVHVVTGTDRAYQGGLFDPVWVSGILKVESSSSELAEAGYRLEATTVESYD